MAKFTDDHKKEMGNYFEEGVHKVKIQAVTLGMTDDKKEYMEFAIKGEGGQEDNARLWFTTDKAIGYSFNIVKGIFVHNAPADKKDATRTAVDKIADTEALEKAAQTLIGKEAWFSVYKSDRTYTAQDGTTKNSYDRNITGYEPTAPKVQTPAPQAPATTESNTPASDGGAPFGF